MQELLVCDGKFRPGETRKAAGICNYGPFGELEDGMTFRGGRLVVAQLEVGTKIDSPLITYEVHSYVTTATKSDPESLPTWMGSSS